MKKQNKDRNATRALMGIDALTGHSIETPMGELVFYIIQPTNIGVLPESSITAAPASTTPAPVMVRFPSSPVPAKNVHLSPVILSFCGA